MTTEYLVQLRNISALPGEDSYLRVEYPELPELMAGLLRGRKATNLARQQVLVHQYGGMKGGQLVLELEVLAAPDGSLDFSADSHERLDRWLPAMLDTNNFQQRALRKALDHIA